MRFLRFGYAAKLVKCPDERRQDDRSVETTQGQELQFDQRALPGVGYIEELKTYIQDAQGEGDQELVEFFNGILENNQRAAQRAKEMLVPRLQSEQE